MELIEQIRENDVFKFRYSPKKEQGWDSRTHCFEGYLVARKSDDELRLVDTYWGIKGDGRVLSQEQIDEEVKNGGSFEFYFNLDDVEAIPDYEERNYSRDDLFRISEQHACVPRCIFHFKRKGAERSQERMLEEVNEQIRKVKSEIESKTHRLEQLAGTRAKLEAGDTSVYI